MASLRRAQAALGLERQIQDADRVIRGFESALAQEAPLPAGPGALQERVSELQVSGHSLNTLGGEVAIVMAHRLCPSSPSAGEGRCWSSRPVCWGCTAS